MWFRSRLARKLHVAPSVSQGVEALERRLLLTALPTPFQGTPQGVPGTVEFEKYDEGGEGVAYHDTTPTNDGGVFRTDGVDIGAATDAGGGYFVGWTNPGEWMNYTVNVASTTTYSIDFRVACGDNGGTFHIALDGANVTGPIHITNTGGWQNWTTLTVPNVPIPAGQHSLRFVIDSAADPSSGIGNFNWMRLRDDPTTSPRTQWWRDAHFGMIIHWGLYSQLAGHWNGQTTPGYGEWIMNDLNIPLAQYAQVASTFNPTLFNAAQWVQIAKSAGMQYIVITSKHHDGFSMFPTSVNTYNIADATPFGRDPLAELSAAARAAGLHFGVYYSILNWADPNASAAGIGTYVQTMETQLHELVTHYDPSILWFDGEWPTWWTDEDGRELEEFIRNINPSIIINNRVGKRLSTDGDFDTPEQVIPAGASPGRLWETAMTLNDTWGYKDTDNDWKSPTTVISNLADIVSKGGNFLLNVGPTGQGIIPAPSVQILQTVGTWLSANGEAIYGAGPAPVPAQTWGSITEKGNAEYAIVFNWPSSGVLHVPVPATAWRAELLNGGSLSFTTSSGAIDITVPTAMPSQPATVIRIDLVPPGTGVITGQVFNDANNSAARDAGETGLAGATVFLDANHNGVLDAGETSTTTDAGGNYAFVGLMPGSYVVSELAPAGYRRTTTYSVTATVAAGRVATGPLFGNVQISTVPMNFAYLLLLVQHYNQPATFATGDLNDDGLVNFDDLLLLAQNYGHPIF